MNTLRSPLREMPGDDDDDDRYKREGRGMRGVGGRRGVPHDAHVEVAS